MQSSFDAASGAALGRARTAASTVVALALLAACGGGGGGDDGPREVPQSCSPNNPYRGDAGGPVVNASLTVEKQWVRAYLDDVYLWYREIPNVNAADPLFSVDTLDGFYASINNYFNALLTPALTPSGKFKDQFSFIYPARLWDEQVNRGSSAGWGIEWHFDTFTTTSINGVKIAYVHAGSPADDAGLRRGDVLTSIGGQPATANSANAVNALLARLYPAAGQQYAFVLSRGGSNVSATLTSEQIALTSVDHSIVNVGAARVGYLLFNDHVLPSERPLIDAIAAMQAQGVSDLVLDLRYNSGGYVYLASELAYMIAGATRTANKTFEGSAFNDKQSARNESTPFFDLACVPDPATFVCSTDAALPTLNLSRVFVLTSADTCSASEAIINGLRGIDVDVRIIGNSTCGKPYGSFGASNCGINYFPLEYKAVNHKGYGDYADGFVPAATDNGEDRVRGCVVADDLSRALGDPAEGQLAAALYMRANNTCPPAATPGREDPLSASRAGTASRVVKPAVLANRFGRLPTR
jgi:carboxyl-terminal processing protease